ncbi:metacaspase-1-like, partial [Phalaenopsis equestris]
DAVNNVKQQCSDFVMTRNIQCREMLEDVQRQMAGLNFGSGPSNPSRTGSHPATDPQSASRFSFKLPFFHQPAQHPRPEFSQPSYPNYTPQLPQPQPSYQQYANQPPSHDYSQPAYPGWRGPYYNTPPQQPGTGHPPPPPYNVPQNYPQGGYYRPQ